MSHGKTVRYEREERQLYQPLRAHVPVCIQDVNPCLRDRLLSGRSSVQLRPGAPKSSTCNGQKNDKANIQAGLANKLALPAQRSGEFRECLNPPFVDSNIHGDTDKPTVVEAVRCARVDAINARRVWTPGEPGVALKPKRKVRQFAATASARPELLYISDRQREFLTALLRALPCATQGSTQMSADLFTELRRLWSKRPCLRSRRLQTGAKWKPLSFARNEVVEPSLLINTFRQMRIGLSWAPHIAHSNTSRGRSRVRITSGAPFAHISGKYPVGVGKYFAPSRATKGRP